MVSKKKRLPASGLDIAESMSKKMRLAASASTSFGSAASKSHRIPHSKSIRDGKILIPSSMIKAEGDDDDDDDEEEEEEDEDDVPTHRMVGGGLHSKKSKEGKVTPASPSIKIEEEEEDIVTTHHTNPVNDDIPDWPEADLLELIKRMEKDIPQKDSLRFDSRADKLNWDSISFSDYTPEQCKEMWSKVQKRLRRFRLLREVLEDAKAWVSKPWTNFYRSQKQNRHPDLPKKPLSTYMLFYLEKKDRVAAENPGLEMTGVSKHIAEIYKGLPTKKKQKYIDMAAAQRKEYDLKMEEFYRDHPYLVPKPVPSKEHKQGAAVEPGPRKPPTPFKLFYTDKENRHKNDSDFDRAELLEKCREQWRSMSDKKKVVWINWALEEEQKYQEELKVYMSENPNFVPKNVKTVLTKEEKNLRERVAGKPEKPPNSGYSLFSRIMLVSPEIKQVAPKERMSQISKLWKCMTDDEKKKYQEQVNHMLDQYKLEYASYLESLPEDKRQEELQNNQPKRKPNKIKARPSKPEVKSKEVKKKTKEVDEKPLYKGEPEPPPVNPYQLFLKTFMIDATHIDIDQRAKEGPRYWDMLPDSEKAKHRNRLNEIKRKYIKDYEKFLKSLSQEQLKDYSLQKANMKKEEEDSSDDSSSGEDDDDDDSSDDSKDSNENQQGSGSDDSSSESDSGSNDSSDSSDTGDNNENNGSGGSSSSGSDSE